MTNALSSLLNRVEFEEDVWVILYESLKPHMQCGKAAARANMGLGQQSVTVTYKDKNRFPPKAKRQTCLDRTDQPSKQE